MDLEKKTCLQLEVIVLQMSGVGCKEEYNQMGHLYNKTWTTPLLLPLQLYGVTLRGTSVSLFSASLLCPTLF
jgi:hypothetical protein